MALPFGDSSSKGSKGMALYFLNADLNAQCGEAPSPFAWSWGTAVGASNGAGDSPAEEGHSWELHGGGMHFRPPEGNGDGEGGGGGVTPPPPDAPPQPVYGSAGRGGDSAGGGRVRRRILLDVSAYHQRIEECIKKAEVTGVLLSHLEDDTRLPVMRVVSIVVLVRGWALGCAVPGGCNSCRCAPRRTPRRMGLFASCASGRV